MKSAQEHAGRPNDEDVPHSLWDSLESDTESLVQEKAYQKELQKRILNGAGENNYSNDGSIKRSEYKDPQPAVTETCEDQNTKNSRQTSHSDEYADLRYDPEWRKKATWSEFLQTDFLFDPSEDPADDLRHKGHLSATGSNEYLIVRSPVSSEVDAVYPKPLQSSFHLHSPEDQDTVLSVPRNSSASVERMNFKPRINHQQSDAGIPPFSSPRQRPHEEQKQSNSQEQNRDNLHAEAEQRKRTQKVRQPTLKEDIIERNKATLGLNSHKQGSYRKVYEQRGGKSDDSNQPVQSAEDTASAANPGSPDNALNLEQMWIQKARKLKMHNQRKHLDRAKLHSQQSKTKGHLMQLEKRQHSQTPSEIQHLSSCDSGSGSHSPFLSAPAVNSNINLNSSAILAEPFIGHKPQKQLCTFPSSSHWRIKNDEFNSCFKEPSYTSCPPVPPSGTLNHESTRLTNKNNIRISPRQPSFQESFNLNAPQLSHSEQESDDSAHVLQTYTRAYSVLPPIGVSNTADIELYDGRPEEATKPVYRSSSDGYLAQLEKQKQINAKTTYKAYTMKDYKSLNLDVKLGGLGPSNTVTGDVAEKIRQQKLYSNVVREQNKKISRIPCLPTRNPVGRDNKSINPRNKALEYAKTIPKLKEPQQLKETSKHKSESERVLEHAAYHQLGADHTQLSTLEMLRKRHEQEKQAVARFTNVHGRSSAPSLSSH